MVDYIKQIYPRLDEEKISLCAFSFDIFRDIHQLNEFLDRFFEWVDRDDVDLNDESIKSFVKTIVDYLLESNDHLVFSQRLYPWIRDYTPPETILNDKSPKTKSEIKLELLSTPTPIRLVDYYESGFLVKMLKSNNQSIITNILSLVLKYNLFSFVTDYDNSYPHIYHYKNKTEIFQNLGYQHSIFPIKPIEDAINNGIINGDNLPKQIFNLLIGIKSSISHIINLYGMDHRYMCSINSESLGPLLRLAIRFGNEKKFSLIKFLYNQTFIILGELEKSEYEDCCKYKDVYKQFHQFFFGQFQIVKPWLNYNQISDKIFVDDQNQIYEDYISYFGQNDFDSQAIQFFLDGTKSLLGSKETIRVALGALSSICDSEIINEHLLIIYNKLTKIIEIFDDIDLYEIAQRILIFIVRKYKNYPESLADQCTSTLLKRNSEEEYLNKLTYIVYSVIMQYCSYTLVKEYFSDILVKMINDGETKLVNEMVMPMDGKFSQHEKFDFLYNLLLINVKYRYRNLCPLVESLVHYNKDHTLLVPIANQILEKMNFYSLNQYQFTILLKLYQLSHVQKLQEYLFCEDIYNDKQKLYSIDDYATFEYIINNIDKCTFLNPEYWVLYKCIIEKGWSDLILKKLEMYMEEYIYISYQYKERLCNFFNTFQSLLNMDKVIQDFILQYLGFCSYNDCIPHSIIADISNNYGPIISKFYIGFSGFYRELIPKMGVYLIDTHYQLFFTSDSKFYIDTKNSGVNQNENLELNLLFIETSLQSFEMSKLFSGDVCRFVSFFSVIDDTHSPRFQNIKSLMVENFKQMCSQTKTILLDYIVSELHANLDRPKQWNYLFDQSQTNFNYQPTPSTNIISTINTSTAIVSDDLVYHHLSSPTCTDTELQANIGLSFLQLPTIIIKTIIQIGDMVNVEAIKTLALISKYFHKMVIQWMTTEMFCQLKPKLGFEVNNSSPYSLLHKGVYKMKYNSFIYYKNQESREEILYQVSSLEFRSNLLYLINRDLPNLSDLTLEFKENKCKMFNSAIENLIDHCPNLRSCCINIINAQKVETLIPIFRKLDQLPLLSKITVNLYDKVPPSTKNLLDNYFLKITKRYFFYFILQRLGVQMDKYLIDTPVQHIIHREKEIKEIYDHLNRDSIVIVDGIGKTQTIYSYAQKYKLDYDFTYEYGDQCTQLEMLSISTQAWFNEDFVNIEQFRETMDKTEKKWLVVVSVPELLIDIYGDTLPIPLNKKPNHHIIFVSEVPHPLQVNCETVHVPPFDNELSIQLFTKLQAFEKTQNEDIQKKLVDLCNGNPQLIYLVSKYINHHHSEEDIHQLIKSLEPFRDVKELILSTMIKLSVEKVKAHVNYIDCLFKVLIHIGNLPSSMDLVKELGDQATLLIKIPKISETKLESFITLLVDYGLFEKDSIFDGKNKLIDIHNHIGTILRTQESSEMDFMMFIVFMRNVAPYLPNDTIIILSQLCYYFDRHFQNLKPNMQMCLLLTLLEIQSAINTDTTKLKNMLALTYNLNDFNGLKETSEYKLTIGNSHMVLGETLTAAKYYEEIVKQVEPESPNYLQYYGYLINAYLSIPKKEYILKALGHLKHIEKYALGPKESTYREPFLRLYVIAYTILDDTKNKNFYTKKFQKETSFPDKFDQEIELLDEQAKIFRDAMNQLSSNLIQPISIILGSGAVLLLSYVAYKYFISK
ncbi:hypothetical protein DLAC_11790 [Tieghemostelium lacteum]|uniref:Uncharacterized protein n=1 Tax=Tieghemostelium lacteum TaxID=361077 RepID=A0A151Z7D2_TIELA|nr:hypothetical protein DLAC_11790 [Tieghemostelium lacteum]|eukprot:KYQ89845.1 hypothetical protein DLAC_11790 [Tieghemostelium lacteum]